MTMPTFDPVATVYEDTLIHGVPLPYGTPLFTAEQLQQAFEAGKAAQIEQEPSVLAYVDPECTEESEKKLTMVSGFVAGQAYNEICLMIGGRWPDAKLENEAPKAHNFFMELLGAQHLAAPPAPAVPDGWKLVPKHPTQDMVEAISPLLQHPAVGMYKAMLAASPEPTKS